MSEQEVDEYLAALNQPQRGAPGLRQTILEIIPDAEQCIAYGVPTFKREGRAVAGFAAFKDHLSYFPHSGSVLSQFPRRHCRIRDIEGDTAVRSRQTTTQDARPKTHRRTNE